MTAADVLAVFRDRGVELSVRDGRLLYRAPAGVIDDDLRRGAAEHRGELLALVSWDKQQADAELRQALAIIDSASAATWLSTAQRNLLAVFKMLVEEYHTQRNRELFGSPAWIEAHFGRWYTEHQEAIRRNRGR